MAILLLYGANRGTDDTDYRLGDLIEAYPDDVAVWLPVPTTPPFWYVRVEGITKERIDELVTPVYNPDGSIARKREWSWRANRVPVAYRNFVQANRFIGFGAEPYISQFSATVPVILSDITLQWSEVRTWIRSKANNSEAPELNRRA